MTAGDDNPLKLRAHDAEDLAVISAMLQDSLVPLGDVTFLPDEKSFVLALNRYRWEQVDASQRVHCGVRFDTVRRVQFSDIDRRNRQQFLSLMAVEFRPAAESGGAIILNFSGGGRIRLEVESISCILSDLDEPWPTQWRPDHNLDEDHNDVEC